jgi:DNA-binding transcriptional LysR family regulator
MEHSSERLVFVAVAHHRSFSGAAQQLGISRSYASRMVAALEARLGVRLLHRTTRRVELSPAGEVLYGRLLQILGALNDAEREISEAQEVVAGPLRVSLPTAFGRRFLMPLLVDFQVRHPRVELLAHFSDSKVDLTRDGFDLVVRGGTLAESSLIVRKLWPFHLHTVASPAYLAARGTPGKPEELADHSCLRYLGNPDPDLWTYARPGSPEPIRISVTGTVTSNSPDALVDFAEAGLGVARQPDFLLQDAVNQGRLVRVLQDFEQPPGAFHAVLPHRDHLPLRIRRLVDHLVGAFERPPWLLDP